VVVVLVRPGGVHADDVVELDAEEAHHLRVRRLAGGEEVELRDGAGLVAHGRLRWEAKRALVEVTDAFERPRPPRVTLAVGAGDKDRFGWLCEKAAELDVTDVQPVVTTLTTGVATRVRAEQVERYRRRAREATKQCGAAWAPVVHDPVSLVQLPREPDGLRWLADPRGGLPPASLGAEPVTVVIGPEGGLTDQERRILLDAGYEPVRLGPHVLRFETAALAAAAAVGLARARAASAPGDQHA
jgi:16S rRNA (uracil1498-N3)-methyltransferase